MSFKLLGCLFVCCCFWVLFFVVVLLLLFLFLEGEGGGGLLPCKNENFTQNFLLSTFFYNSSPTPTDTSITGNNKYVTWSACYRSSPDSSWGINSQPCHHSTCAFVL